MARIRSLNPEFFLDEQLAELPHRHRLAFQGLWCYADREGRLQDRPSRLKALIFPYEKCDFNAILNDLTRKPFLIRYEVDDRKYIQIKNFDRYQRPHHTERESELPPCNGSATVKAPLDNGEAPDVKIKIKIHGKDSDKGQQTKPSPKEIEEHFRSKGIPGAEKEALKFFSYYESVGWVVGKARKPMKSWRAAVDNWLRHKEEMKTGKQTPPARSYDRENKEFDDNLKKWQEEQNETPKV